MAAEWVASGTHLGDFPGLPATGNAFNIRGISMIELGDDGVRRVSDYWDLAGSGLLPMPPGTGFGPHPPTPSPSRGRGGEALRCSRRDG